MTLNQERLKKDKKSLNSDINKIIKKLIEAKKEINSLRGTSSNALSDARSELNQLVTQFHANYWD